MMGQKGVGISLLVLAGLQLGFSYAGLRFWRCPWREYLGWRCPGCGLTSGCRAIMSGNLEEGIARNWLSPLVVIALLVLAVSFAIPGRARQKLVQRIKAFEGATRIGLFVIALLLLQTLLRLFGKA